VVAGETTWRTTRAVSGKVAVAEQEHERGRKSDATGQRAALKPKQTGPSAEQMDLGEAWNHVIQDIIPPRNPITTS